MQRRITVYVDPSTFPNGRRPRGFGVLNTRNSIDVLSVLLHTALWTRSPLIQGLQLSDFWAWLRYGVAIDQTPDLRLRHEWDDIDPHQKTILSDELGVGVTTYLLADTLGYQQFVDTNYVVRTGTPANINLRRNAKRGPRKAPDYIAIDSRGNFVALECKGTQSSRTALVKAMEKGIPQKENASGSGGSVLNFGLVAGLFVPQKSNPDMAYVLFWDPDWDDFSSVINNMSREKLQRCLRSGSLANQLALAGAPTAAEEIARRGLVPLGERALSEISNLERSRIIFDTTSLREVNPGLPVAQLLASTNPRTIDALLSTDPESRLADDIDSQRWLHEENGSACRMLTPEGFEFYLTLENPNEPIRKPYHIPIKPT